MESMILERPAGQAEQAWAGAMAELNRLETECDEKHRLYDAAFKRFCELRPDRASIPTGELPIYCERDLLERDLSDVIDTLVANHGRTWWGDLESAKATKQAAIDAVHAYRQQHEQARSITNVDAIEEAASRAADALSDAEMALVQMRAPTPAALRWKLRRLFGPGDSIWAEEYTRQTYEDIDRFLGGDD
ncbi:hypothetical protein H8M03_02535 [Sphingomonas sabuli]|uniref:Uncharacterized protein n=1 Tax=Sphingomonas sabuli TaxID=2764186 RepID=A0A7G9L3P7_9SPHN|nr:hypothetical protein [Sphingomonas sabuli]QNM83246.1 hypothetical protein H8M03_02535 [Sphingomonas sabuli]